MCVEANSSDIIEVLAGTVQPGCGVGEWGTEKVETKLAAEDGGQSKRRISGTQHARGGSQGLLAGLSFGHAALSTTFQSLHATICSFKGWSYLGVPPPPAQQLGEQRARPRVIRFVGSTSLASRGVAPVLELRSVNVVDTVDSDDASDSGDADGDDSANSGDEESYSEGDDDEAGSSCDSEPLSPNNVLSFVQYSQPDLMRLCLDQTDSDAAAPSSSGQGITASQRCTSAPCTSDCNLSNHHNHRHQQHNLSSRAQRPLLLLELPGSPGGSCSGTVSSAVASAASAAASAAAFGSPRTFCAASSSSQLLMLMPPGSSSSPRASVSATCSSPRMAFQSSPEEPCIWLPEIIKCGLFCEQGTRASNEDMAFALEIFEPPLSPFSSMAEGSLSPSVMPSFSRAACFGVFDGHGGIEAAEHMTQNLPGLISSRCSHIKAQGAEEVTSIMLALEAQLQERFHAEWHSTGRDPGTTALVATVIDDTLLVANVGDCRLILVAEAVDAQGNRIAYVSQATKDHTCGKNEGEHRRVQEAGAHVDADGYVGSLLEVSRSIGDFRTKSELGAGVIIPDPEVTSLQLSADSLFVVAFSDGISSRMDDCSVCNMVAALLNDRRHPNDPAFAARELCTYAVGSAGSSDNCSAVVVVLREAPPPAPAKRRLFNRK